MGAFKLGKMTFGSLFKKPETTLYPFEKKPQPAGLKGHIVVDADACILCGMCERNCTTDCITVNKAERFWEMNHFACIQCGYCVTVCPKKCLHMDPNYWAAAPHQACERVAVPEQGAAKQAAKGDAGKAAAAAESAQPAQEAPAAQTAQPAQPAAAAAPAAVTQPAAPAKPAATPSTPAAPKKPDATPAAETAPIADAQPAACELSAKDDPQLAALIALMDPEKAKIVESALAGR